MKLKKYWEYCSQVSLLLADRRNIHIFSEYNANETSGKLFVSSNVPDNKCYDRLMFCQTFTVFL